MRLLILFMFSLLSGISWGKDDLPGRSLSGKITDMESGEPLQGVSVYFPDLKAGTLSNADGTYKIENLPSTTVLIKISMTGYTAITERIDLLVTETKDFSLERTITEISEVVITGLSQSTEQRKSPAPVSVVPQEHLQQNSSTNIIDALSREPGVTQITTGSGISKPVVRGLGFNRVVVINDGIRQEGQQWGDEHGIEIDEFSVNKVEILKGPASLMYGSDAMGGVIHMISAPTLPRGTMRGHLLSNYQTNNGLIAGSGNLAGNLNGWVFDARYSRKAAHAYQNKYDGFVPGTKFNEESYGGIFGLNRPWGYSHLHLSTYHMLAELAEGERDSATGGLIIPFSIGDSMLGEMIPSASSLKNYSIGIPYQDIFHRKAVLNNSFFIRNGRLNLVLGWQQNERLEYADMLVPDAVELHFLMNTLNYDLRYILPEKDSLQISAGINGMDQVSENRGEEILIPEYHLFDVGAFTTFRKSWKKTDLSGGLRLDHRSVTSVAFGDTTGEERTLPFNSISGSIGLAWAMTNTWYSKFNLSRGFRAPNLAELGSYGVHEGTFRFEIGNPDLFPETSHQLDVAVGVNTDHVTLEMSLFGNYIKNFIYPEKLLNAAGGDSIPDPSDPVPAFRFTQNNAWLYGGEISMDLHPHPLDWLHIENSFSWVNAVRENGRDSARFLPFMPAPKFVTDLRAEFEKAGRFMRELYIMAGTEIYLRQNKVYSAYGTEAKTPGYVLLHAGIGADFCSGKHKLFSLYVNGTNLTDAAYQSHLSRLKYTAVNNLTGRKGIFNMGRNISIKLVIPLGIRKAQS